MPVCEEQTLKEVAFHTCLCPRGCHLGLHVRSRKLPSMPVCEEQSLKEVAFHTWLC